MASSPLNSENTEAEKIKQELRRINSQLEQMDDSITVTDGVTTEIMCDNQKIEEEVITLTLRVKQLELKFDELETESKLTDSCLQEFDADMEEGRNNVEKLEKRVTQLESDLEGVSELFEERVATLKVQNVELRHHINLVVDMVNNITRVLNETFCKSPEEEVPEVPVIEQADKPEDEAIVVDTDDDDDNETTPLTVQQVYDMYQSQPQDEEGWDQMVKDIKSAEEYESSLQSRVNGLTQHEWNDLLRI